MLALYCMFFKVNAIKILIFLTLKNINYKASIIGILMMLALKNINYKTSIIGFLMMLALKKINYKGSIHTIRKCSKIDGQKYIPNFAFK